MTHRQFACGLLLILACKGDDGIDSGLPPDKTGDQLMPAEQTSLCEASNEYLTSHISESDWKGYLCTLESLGDAEGADVSAQIAACKQLRADCIAVPSDDTLGSACDDVDDWSTCGASVAEIEGCLTDSIDLLDGLIRDFTCDILDPARAMAVQEKYGDAVTDPFPPSCDVVQAKCPTLLGGGVDAENGQSGDSI